MMSTDFPGVVGAQMTSHGARMHRASGGGAHQPTHVVVVVPHPMMGALEMAILQHHAAARAAVPRQHKATGGLSTTTANLDWLASQGRSAPGTARPASMSTYAEGDQYMPTARALTDMAGVSPTYGTGAMMAAGLAGPPGLALGALNTVGNVINTSNNADMLGRMGYNVPTGQVLGGLVGGSLAGTPSGALNSAMNSPGGRSALSLPQSQGTQPSVSMPTQTAPTTAVESSPLGAPMGGGYGSSSGDEGDASGGDGYWRGGVRRARRRA